MTTTTELLDLAQSHLDQAAICASTELAAQIRLAAAALPGVPAMPVEDELDVTGHLAAALAALDAIGPGDGPADLQLCAWHLHELLRIARQSQAA